jgi:hypothetical protein
MTLNVGKVKVGVGVIDGVQVGVGVKVRVEVKVGRGVMVEVTVGEMTPSGIDVRVAGADARIVFVAIGLSTGDGPHAAINKTVMLKKLNCLSRAEYIFIANTHLL